MTRTIGVAVGVCVDVGCAVAVLVGASVSVGAGVFVGWAVAVAVAGSVTVGSDVLVTGGSAG